MSSVDLDPLSDEAKRLLAFERAFSPQPAGLRERAFSRARAALGRSVGVVAPDVRQWRHTRLLMAAAVVMVLTAVAFAKWGGSLPTVEGPAVSAQATKGPSKGSTAAPSTPVAAADATTETVSPPAAALPQKGELAAARPSPGVDAYSLELALLQRARAAVASGRFSAALHAIAEHQRRFPTGHFLEEREALRVKALAGLGRTDEAHRAAEKFRSRFPDSVLSSRIEGAIQEAP
jgi:TolA-binding protein